MIRFLDFFAQKGTGSQLGRQERPYSTHGECRQCDFDGERVGAAIQGERGFVS